MNLTRFLSILCNLAPPTRLWAPWRKRWWFIISVSPEHCPMLETCQMWNARLWAESRAGEGKRGKWKVARDEGVPGTDDSCSVPGLRSLGMTITQCYEEVGLLLLFLSVGISIFSTVEYFAEQSIPDTTFTSVPCAWWWATTSMTTVGYGDIRPDTTTGKIVAFMCILSGILVLALPIAIINDRFSACYFTLKLKEAAVRQREALKKLTKNIATDSYISVNLRDVYARSIMEMLRLKGRERASTRSSGGDDFWFWIHFQFMYKSLCTTNSTDKALKWMSVYCWRVSFEYYPC